MKKCSLNTFLEEIAPWLDSKYIHRAETDSKGHFILHFHDGTKHSYQIDDCNEKQKEKIILDLKAQGIKITG
nr:hypothetical protein [Desulfobulbaceae bacterium]